VSEELEHSLQQAIESYLGKRLSAIDEQLSRLQNDLDAGLKRLRESSAGESLDASPLSAAIFAHLQSARAQRLSGPAPERPPASEEIATLRRAVEAIESQQKHADILSALLTAAAQFAERAALFVVRNDQAIGWRECEAGDPTNLEMIGGVSLSLSANTMLGRAVRSQTIWTGAPESNSEDNLLIDQLGGSPQSVAAVPLLVRGRAVAILYADAASSDPNALNLDALGLLSRVAAMAVNISATPRVPEKQAEQRTESETAAPVTAAETSETTVVSAPPGAEPTYTPEVEPQRSEVMAQPVAEEVPTEPEAKPVAESVAEPVVAAEAPTEPLQEISTPVNDFVSPTVKPAIEPGFETPAPAEPSFASQYSAPLGGARRYGVSEPELPIEVGEEERRLHNDARRFARLLVSEIKLYNEPKVKEGRSRGDIYDRLREDIDRSRQMYDKRVAPPVAARHDYFHQELVNTLAEGDPAKLGQSYPGASLAPN
jgi:hypothetical protein